MDDVGPVELWDAVSGAQLRADSGRAGAGWSTASVARRLSSLEAAVDVVDVACVLSVLLLDGLLAPCGAVFDLGSDPAGWRWRLTAAGQRHASDVAAAAAWPAERAEETTALAVGALLAGEGARAV